MAWRRLVFAALLGLTVSLPASAQETPSGETVVASTPVTRGDPAPAVTRPDPDPDSGSAALEPVRRSSKPAKKRRGGIHPCMTPDPGYGVYDKWQGGIGMGQFIAPHKGGITKNGSFDVIIHFHGHEPIRKEFVKSADGIVLVGIDLGIGSGAYSSAFASPSAFTNLLAGIEREMAEKTGKKKAKIRKLALSSWSAGYGAVDQILRQPAGKKVDALILLDSVHAGYRDEQNKTLKTEQLDAFVDFAKKAARGEKLMFLSHSSIIPPGYASTAEVAHFLVGKVGGKPKKADREDVLGLDMIERYDRQGFKVRGYTGDDKPDHCAHIGLMKDVIRVHLEPRWKPPKGRK